MLRQISLFSFVAACAIRTVGPKKVAILRTAHVVLLRHVVSSCEIEENGAAKADHGGKEDPAASPEGQEPP